MKRKDITDTQIGYLVTQLSKGFDEPTRAFEYLIDSAMGKFRIRYNRAHVPPTGHSVLDES